MHDVPIYSECSKPEFGPASFKDVPLKTERFDFGHRDVMAPACRDMAVREFNQWKQANCSELHRCVRAEPGHNFRVIWRTPTKRNEHFKTDLADCEVFVRNVTDTFNRQRSHLCPVERYERHPDPDHPPVYETCRDISHGDEPPPGSCEIEPTRLYSRASTISDLAQANPWAVTAGEINESPHCQSCEDMPINSRDQVRTKFRCLAQRLTHLESESNLKGPDEAWVRQKVKQQMQLMYEFVGSMLTPEQRMFVLDSHDDLHNHDPGCGFLFHALDLPTGCDETRDALPRLYGCKRLLLSHVDVGVVKSARQMCVELIREAAENRACLTEELRAELSALNDGLLAKSTP